MTEEEAKTKWCPKIQISINNGGGTRSNRGEWGAEDGVNYHCIASGCMAWRRDEQNYEAGYCGLAGIQP